MTEETTGQETETTESDTQETSETQETTETTDSGTKTTGETLDQDPGVQTAKAAEQRFNDILEKHGFDSADELVEALEAGQSLREILGDRDAEQMKSDADEMQRTRAYWAQKKAEKRKSEETPEETIDRYEKRIKELEDFIKADSDDRAAREESARALNEYDAVLTNLASSDSELANDQELALLMLGIKNPAVEVMPEDRKAVKQAGIQTLTRLKQLLAKRDQAVIDAYVAGKSKITPIKETSATTGSPTIQQEEEPLKPGITLDEVNALAKKEILDTISKAE